jgi:hypothetical protein
MQDFEKTYPHPRLYKSGLLGINDIDLLYSEFSVLNL